MDIHIFDHNIVAVEGDTILDTHFIRIALKDSSGANLYLSEDQAAELRAAVDRVWPPASKPVASAPPFPSDAYADAHAGEQLA